jgi:signal transduction histidine kinase
LANDREQPHSPGEGTGKSPARSRLAVDQPEKRLQRPAHGKAAEQLRAVVEGLKAIAVPVATSVDEVLGRIATVARDLTGAEYCALGIGTDPQRQFDPWVYVGMTEEQAAAIGRAPRPVCLLGAVLKENRTIRLANTHYDARFCGFPPRHPSMGSFLGVPIRLGERTLGHLYLTNKAGASSFNEEDELIVEALAAHAAVAVESARLYEEARQRTAELEEERLQRETFISVVSHELRGPITVLMGYAELMAGFDRLPPERRERALKAIGDQTHLMNRLIGDLLDTSRIQTGRFAVEKATTDLAEIARQSVAAQQAVVTDHPIELLAPPSLTVEADEARIGQVMGNLLTNAAKYSPPGSRIWLRLSADEHEVVASVTDEGVGIAPEQMALLFHPYSRLFREHHTAKGIGLGLFVSKGIVQAHGGRMWAESPGPSQGTTFYFTLPHGPQPQ